MNLELLTQPETYVSLLTLTAMEIVLGIDNIVFISILAGKLPAGAAADGARRLGLSLALVLAARPALRDLLGHGADASRCSPCSGMRSRDAT